MYLDLSEITPKGHKTTRIKSVNHPTKFHNGVYLYWGHSKIDNILLMNCPIEYPLKNIKNSVLVFVNKRTAFVIKWYLGKINNVCNSCLFVLQFCFSVLFNLNVCVYMDFIHQLITNEDDRVSSMYVCTYTVLHFRALLRSNFH